MTSFPVSTFSLVAILVISLVFPKQNLGLLSISESNPSQKSRAIQTICICSLLAFFAIARGDFTQDYVNTITYFNYISNVDVWTFIQLAVSGKLEVTSSVGYYVLCKLLIIGGYSFAIGSLAVITLALLGFAIYRDSDCIWLSLCLYVGFGSFYTSFNLIRQALIVAYALIIAKTMYRRDNIGLLFAVAFGLLFHTSILFLIPLYLISFVKWERLDIGLHLVLFAIVLLASFYSGEWLVHIFDELFGFVLGSDSIQELPITSLILPMSISLFTLLLFRYIDFDNRKERVWFSAVILLPAIAILALNGSLLIRFESFCSAFATLLIPSIISKIGDSAHRQVIVVIVVFFVIAYTLFSSNLNAYSFLS